MNDRPAPRRKASKNKKPQTREERLAEALRANLRRRKAPRGSDEPVPPATEKPQNES